MSCEDRGGTACQTCTEMGSTPVLAQHRVGVMSPDLACVVEVLGRYPTTDAFRAAFIQAVRPAFETYKGAVSALHKNDTQDTRSGFNAARDAYIRAAHRFLGDPDLEQLRRTGNYDRRFWEAVPADIPDLRTTLWQKKRARPPEALYKNGVNYALPYELRDRLIDADGSIRSAEVERLLDAHRQSSADQDGQTVSDMMVSRHEHKFTFVERLALGMDLGRTTEGNPILWQEARSSNRQRTVKASDGLRQYRVPHTFQFTVFQAGPRAEDVDFQIEIEDWDWINGCWQSHWRKLTDSEVVSGNQQAFKLAARLTFAIQSRSDTRPPIRLAGGTPLLPDEQPLARALLPFPTFQDFCDDLRSAIRAAYRPLPAGSSPDANTLPAQAAAIQSLLPRLGFTERDQEEIGKALARVRPENLPRLPVRSRHARYLQVVRPDAYRLLKELVAGISSSQPVDEIVDRLSSALPRKYFDWKEAPYRSLLEVPDGDSSHAGVEARLARGEAVAPELILPYPDLVARYGM